MPYDEKTGTWFVDRTKQKMVPGDCNSIARDRAGARSGCPTPAYCRNYDEINWKSKAQRRDA